MQDNSDKSIFELVADLGGLLAERRRLEQELLPPQLRTLSLPELPYEGCDAYDSFPGRDDADRCGSSSNVCKGCNFCGRHCVCPF
jgi:hypothetical protein